MKSDKKLCGRMGMNMRHFRRQQSHEESHSQAETLLPIAAHALASGEAASVVTTGAELAEAVDHLKAEGAMAFDCEFIGEMSYAARLCLVQAATARGVFILDPLVGLDLSSLWELIADSSVEKIVLAGQQDFALVAQQTGRPPANVMDLQIAAGFVHVAYPLSLARLIQEFVGVPLGKAHTFTHWDNRPLSAVQMRYAADDVRYLPAAREAIGRRLAEAGRAAWAREECAAALEDPSLYRAAPESIYLRVRGRERLSRRQLAVLREMAIVRDEAARRENVPARTLMRDGVLLSLARRPVVKLEDLDAVRGLPRPVESAYGRQIVEATARALALPADRLPPEEPEERSAQRGIVDHVWAEMGKFCLERGVALALVASRKEVGRLCRAAAKGQSLEPHRLTRGWRKELLGDLLEKLL